MVPRLKGYVFLMNSCSGSSISSFLTNYIQTLQALNERLRVHSIFTKEFSNSPYPDPMRVVKGGVGLIPYRAEGIAITGAEACHRCIRILSWCMLPANGSSTQTVEALHEQCETFMSRWLYPPLWRGELSGGSPKHLLFRMIKFEKLVVIMGEGGIEKLTRTELAPTRLRTPVLSRTLEAARSCLAQWREMDTTWNGHKIILDLEPQC